MLLTITMSYTENLLPKPVMSKTILRTETIMEARESDIWLAFLIETGLISAREVIAKTLGAAYHDITGDDLEYVLRQIGCCYEQRSESSTTNIRDEYEDIHRRCPGLFWDTVIMDDEDAAYRKIKKIVYEIVQSQKSLKPMFDIDFANMNDYPIVKTRLQNICKQIAPHRLFH